MQREACSVQRVAGALSVLYRCFCAGYTCAVVCMSVYNVVRTEVRRDVSWLICLCVVVSSCRRVVSVLIDNLGAIRDPARSGIWAPVGGGVDVVNRLGRTGCWSWSRQSPACESRWVLLVPLFWSRAGRVVTRDEGVGGVWFPGFRFLERVWWSVFLLLRACRVVSIWSCCAELVRIC